LTIRTGSPVKTSLPQLLKKGVKTENVPVLAGLNGSMSDYAGEAGSGGSSDSSDSKKTPQTARNWLRKLGFERAPLQPCRENRKNIGL
jgi:hypothetical protein